LALPVCVTWIVHVPRVSKVTVVPVTLQIVGVAEAKVTISKDDAVALIVNGADPKASFDNEPKVIA
jgi:hypothetical protein